MGPLHNRIVDPIKNRYPSRSHCPETPRAGSSPMNNSPSRLGYFVLVRLAAQGNPPDQSALDRTLKPYFSCRLGLSDGQWRTLLANTLDELSAEGWIEAKTLPPDRRRPRGMLPIFGRHGTSRGGQMAQIAESATDGAGFGHQAQRPIPNGSGWPRRMGCGPRCSSNSINSRSIRSPRRTRP